MNQKGGIHQKKLAHHYIYKQIQANEINNKIKIQNNINFKYEILKNKLLSSMA